MSKVEIKKINSGEIKEVVGNFLVTKSEVLTAVNGNEFLTLTLSDGKLEMIARLFNFTNGFKPEPGEVVYIDGIVNEWKGSLSIKLNSLVPSKMLPLEFKKHGPNTPEECLSKLLGFIDVLPESEMCCLTSNLIESNKESFLTAPAAISKHHAYEGGAVQHTLEVTLSAISEVKISNEVAKLNLDVSLTTCGAILHDIGKLRCYFMNGEVPEMTTAGKFKDHIAEGLLMLNEEAVKLNIDRTQEWFMKLEHIILSHHGKLEWGSPVAPCFPEAYIIHQADMNSSRIVSMQESINEINGEWGTKRDWMFGSYLYAGVNN